jgi:hypothetical protein
VGLEERHERTVLAQWLLDAGNRQRSVRRRSGSGCCSDRCSGRGSCYWAGIATGLQVADCAVSDLSCEPVCNCTGTSFTGTACELAADDLRVRQAIRGQLFQSLKALTVCWRRSAPSMGRSR